MLIGYTIGLTFILIVVFIEAGRMIGKKLPSRIPSWDPLSLMVYIATPIIGLMLYDLLSVEDSAIFVAIPAALLAFIYGHSIADIKYRTIKIMNPQMAKPKCKILMIVYNKDGEECIQGQRFVDKLRTLRGRYDPAPQLKECKILGDEVQDGRYYWVSQKDVIYCMTWTSDRDKVMADRKRIKEENKVSGKFWIRTAALIGMVLGIEYAIFYASTYAAMDLMPYLFYVWAVSVILLMIKIMLSLRIIDLDYSFEHKFTFSDTMGLPDREFYHTMDATGRIMDGAFHKISEVREDSNISKARLLSAIDCAAADDFDKSLAGDALNDILKRIKGDLREETDTDESEKDENNDEKKG